MVGEYYLAEEIYNLINLDELRAKIEINNIINIPLEDSMLFKSVAYYYGNSNCARKLYSADELPLVNFSIVDKGKVYTMLINYDNKEHITMTVIDIGALN